MKMNPIHDFWLPGEGAPEPTRRSVATRSVCHRPAASLLLVLVLAALAAVLGVVVLLDGAACPLLPPCASEP